MFLDSHLISEQCKKFPKDYFEDSDTKMLSSSLFVSNLTKEERMYLTMYMSNSTELWGRDEKANLLDNRIIIQNYLAWLYKMKFKRDKVLKVGIKTVFRGTPYNPKHVYSKASLIVFNEDSQESLLSMQWRRPDFYSIIWI